MTVGTDKTYRSQDPGNRLIAWGKYLVPRGALTPLNKLVAAPKDFVRLSEVAFPEGSQELIGMRSERHAKITYSTLSGTVSLPASEVCCFYQGNMELLQVPERVYEGCRFYSIPGGHCVGRNGCLVDGDGKAIFETGFMYKPGIAESKKFHVLDPRHWKHIRRGNLTARKRVPAPQSLPGVSFSINNCSTHNFYHWMLEVAPRVLAAKYAGQSVDYYIVDHQKSYQKEVLSLLGTQPKQWVQPHCNLNLKCEKLLWSSEPCYRLLHGFANHIMAASKLQDRGANFEASGMVSEEPRHNPEVFRKVYITRRNASHRKLRNEREVENYLGSHGFETCDFDSLSFNQQLSLIGSASHLVAIHGAALANTAFAQAGLKIIEIVPAGRSNYYLYPNQSRLFGHQHCLVQATSTRYRQKLNCAVEDLEAALKAIERHSENSESGGSHQ